MANLTVTVEEIIKADEALDWLGGQDLKEKVLAMVTTKRMISAIMEDFSKARNMIISRHSDDGINVRPADVYKANVEIAALTKETVEVYDPKISWDMVKDLPWTTNRLYALLWLIHDVPVEKDK
jgi:hypothetical protein